MSIIKNLELYTNELSPRQAIVLVNLPNPWYMCKPMYPHENASGGGSQR